MQHASKEMAGSQYYLVLIFAQRGQGLRGSLTAWRISGTAKITVITPSILGPPYLQP
jgi:hypothetical protein